jgi:phage-related tail fiber protein
MKTQVLLIGLAFAVAGAPARAIDPDPAVKKTFEKLIDAVKANDRDAFIADGTEAVKKGVTEEVMEVLSKQLGARLKKGYEATYLCQLKQASHQVHLWKVTFKDGGDDIVIRVALKDGKVDGFFLQ